MRILGLEIMGNGIYGEITIDLSRYSRTCSLFIWGYCIISGVV